jgi:hypothetical protein
VICTGPGTCVPECELYSRCHCGCGEATSAPGWTHRSHGYVKGRHHRYLWQHFRPSNPYDGDRCGVPYEDVRGMVNALFGELGLREASERVGVSGRCLSMWRNGHMAHVQRRSAVKIKRAYDSLDGQLRRVQLPTAPLRDFFAAHGLTPTMVWPKSHYHARAFHKPTVSLILADEMAIAVGYHPSAIWDGWFDLEAPSTAPATTCVLCLRRCSEKQALCKDCNSRAGKAA